MYIRTYDTFDIIFASNKVESFFIFSRDLGNVGLWGWYAMKHCGSRWATWWIIPLK